MLTGKQRRLLQLIESGIRERGIAPTYDELRAHLGLASKSSIYNMVRALQERGYIHRLRYRARAIEVLKPAPVGAGAGSRSPDAEPSSDLACSIPLLGAVAAGAPVVVWEDPHRTITVPPAYARPGYRHFALEVRGDSMIGAGICEGDIAIIRRQSVADSGDIVVAMVDGENTLKRLQVDTRQRTLRLVAENPDYDDIEIEANALVVQGKLVSLLRRYDDRDAATEPATLPAPRPAPVAPAAAHR